MIDPTSTLTTRTESLFLINSVGYYPQPRRPRSVRAHRLHQCVNNYRIGIIDPLHELQSIINEKIFITTNFTCEILLNIIQDQSHILRSGNLINPESEAIPPTIRLKRTDYRR